MQVLKGKQERILESTHMAKIEFFRVAALELSSRICSCHASLTANQLREFMHYTGYMVTDILLCLFG